MGAGASTLGPGSVGKFQLSEEQAKQNDVLSNLVLSLLQNNNLLDLSKLVERSDAKCEELILTLSSQLEKEFQTLRFPDPSRKQPDVQASYMAQDRYRILSTNPDPARKDICRFLATFLLRFVLLIAATVSSISITDAIPALSRQKMVPMLLKKEGEQYEPLKAFYKPSTVIMDNLVKTHFAIKDESDASLYILDNKYNFSDGYLYRRDSTKDTMTRVLGVEMGYAPILKPSQPGMPSQPRTFLSQFTAQEEYERELSAAKRETERLRSRMNTGYDRGFDRGYGDRGYGFPQREQNISGFKKTLEDFGSELRTVRQPIYPIDPQQYADLVNELRTEGSKGTEEGIFSMKGDTLILTKNGVEFRVTTGPGVSNVSNTRTTRTANSRASNTSYQSTLRQNIQRVGPGQYKDETQERSYIMMIRLYDPTVCPELTEGCFSSILAELYMDDYGRTYDKQTYERFYGKVEPQLSVPFSTRIEEALGKTTLQVRVGEKAASSSNGVQTKELLDFQLQPKTIEYIKSLNLKGLTIEAPAALRAYLLATEVFSKMEDGKTQQYLKYSFCRDPWQDKPLDDVTAYSLLASLYKEYDTREGRYLRDSPAMEDFVRKMITENIAKADSNPGNWKAKFQKLPREGLGDIVCTTEEVAMHPAQKAKIQVLQGSHAKLRGMYDRHLRNVVEFIKTVLVVDDTFLRAMARPGRYLEEALAEPVLRLHPNFVSNPNGSFEVLQERTNVARKMLSDHYFEVEKVYIDTIQQLHNLAAGVAPIKGLKGGRRTRRTYKSTRGKRTRRS